MRRGERRYVCDWCARSFSRDPVFIGKWNWRVYSYIYLICDRCLGRVRRVLVSTRWST